jgi:ABC-type sugar transport system substrate-binding protein
MVQKWSDGIVHAGKTAERCTHRFCATLKFDGVLAANDPMAIGAIESLKAANAGGRHQCEQ